MNSAHRKTLALVFSTPVPAGVAWARIEALLRASGCEVYEGRGSRVTFSRGGYALDAHRPHPGKEAKRYQVRDVRAFLEKIGVTPQREGT